MMHMTVLSVWFQSISELIENTIPSSIRLERNLRMDDPVCKFFPPHCLQQSLVREAEKHVWFVVVI